MIGTCCNDLDDEVNVVVKRVAEFLAAKNDIQRTERETREKFVCLFDCYIYFRCDKARRLVNNGVESS